MQEAVTALAFGLACGGLLACAEVLRRVRGEALRAQEARRVEQEARGRRRVGTRATDPYA